MIFFRITQMGDREGLILKGEFLKKTPTDLKSIGAFRFGY